MKRMTWIAVLIASVTFHGCGGGGGDGGGGGSGNGTCVEMLPGCDAGEPTCEGQYVRTCNADGNAYLYVYCFQQACKNGACSAAACVEPGRATCTDVSAGSKCKEDFSIQMPFDCGDGTTCAGGECFPLPCDAGEVRCAPEGGSVTCTEDKAAWAFAACAAGEYCDLAAANFCVPMHPHCVLNPLGRFCEDLATAKTCTPEGRAETTSCGDKEVCVEGFCQKKACGVTYEPVVDEDTSTPTDAITVDDATDDLGDGSTPPLDTPKPDIPPLEPKSVGEVSFNGGDFAHEKVKFTSNLTANYIHADKTLQVKMAKGGYILEIQIQNIEEGVVGNFSSADPGSVTAVYLFNDGSELQGDMQWRYVSSEYDVTLEEFGPANEGRVKGTFSGQLQDQLGGDPVNLSEGNFDVPRKE
ncbi:MAG: hypothetical protein ABIK09_17610 [Pseudomonadota bacterium]